MLFCIFVAMQKRFFFLFFVSTIGSAAGTLGTSFYLVLWFEVNEIVFGTAGALALIGAVLMVAGIRRGQVDGA